MEYDVFKLQQVADRFSKIGSQPELTKTDLIPELLLCKNYIAARASKKIRFEFPESAVNIYYAQINSNLFSWVVENYLNWFDREFTPFFATEIIGGRQRDGYQIAGNALILKFEELQGAGARAVALYSQRPQFKLLRENVGGDKSYGELYRQVAGAIRFPADFVGHLCESKYVRHFYSEDERRRMLERWT